MDLLRAESSQGSSSKLGFNKLPPATIQRAAMRLGWVSLACAIVTVTIHFLQQRLQPEVAAIQHRLPILINTIAVVALSLSTAAASRFGWLPPAAILAMGLALEAVGGFALATFDYLLPWHPQQPIRGTSWMAIWICMCGLVIPNRPAFMMAAMLLTASMGPLAYFLFHPAPIPLNLLLLWNIPNYLVGFATVLIARRLYKLEMEVHQARELGSYQLEKRIARGGMGEVWQATHRRLARQSAVKVIRPEMLVDLAGRDATFVRRRFEQEAKVTAALRSPHTVELYDFGVAEDGSFYYVMELLEGIDLEMLVRRFGPQPPDRVIALLLQVCESLAEAHRAALVHRDIKPTNIFLCRMGIRYDFAKVLDFGLVKARLGEGASLLTKEGVTAGTPAYIAPEILSGNMEIDGRADLYGLGCVAYWLLTGNLVFDKGTPIATAIAHVQEDPIPLSQRTELSIPPALERTVMACLAKKPRARPATAEMLIRMLNELPESRSWTPDRAEAWWHTNHPEAVAKEVDESQPKSGVPAA